MKLLAMAIAAPFSGGILLGLLPFFSYHSFPLMLHIVLSYFSLSEVYFVLWLPGWSRFGIRRV